MNPVLLDVVLPLFALGRVLIGLAPFVAARRASLLLGFPAGHDSPTARVMARFFGVRDAGLGVLVLYGRLHPETLPFFLLFNAAMDAGDLMTLAIPIVRRQGIDRGAWTSMAFAATGGLGWLVVWAISR